MRLETKLVFNHKSPYLPICLPPRCDEDHECRTRDGNNKNDLIGTRTVTTLGNYRSEPNLRIITNSQCNFANFLTQPGNTGIRQIRRYMIQNK